jgi:hypothetical protein
MAYNNMFYLNFPIEMLRDLIRKKGEVLNNIIDYGVYKYALKYSVSVDLESFVDASKTAKIRLGSPQRSLNSAINLHSKFGKKCAMAGISRKKLFEYYNHEKSDYELLQLACFLAIKSIIGVKPYCKTNKALIHARMFGFINIKDVPPIAKMSKLQSKYFAHDGINKYHIDKLLQVMQVDWHLKLISDHSKGFYLSFDLNLEQLAKIEQSKKKSTKLKLLKDAKALAIAKAKSALLQQH